MGRYASIDYGLARIGLAVSDEMKIIASSLGMIAAERTPLLSAKKIMKTLSTYELEIIIVGLPLHMNGTKSSMANEVLHFISLLQQETPVQVLPWDERLSTAQAEKALRECNFSRKKRADKIDGVAAALSLQSFLDLKRLEHSR